MGSPDAAVAAMGLDVGEARIGVAISEAGLLSSPHGALRRTPAAAAEVAALAERLGAAVIVIGLPLRMRGGEGNQAAAVRAFGAEVAALTARPIEYYDERLTTVMAERELQGRGVRGAKRKQQIDATAAAIILQGWLDSRRLAAARAAEGE